MCTTVLASSSVAYLMVRAGRDRFPETWRRDERPGCAKSVLVVATLLGLAVNARGVVVFVAVLQEMFFRLFFSNSLTLHPYRVPGTRCVI